MATIDISLLNVNTIIRSDLQAVTGGNRAAKDSTECVGQAWDFAQSKGLGLELDPVLTTGRDAGSMTGTLIDWSNGDRTRAGYVSWDSRAKTCNIPSK